MPGITGAEQAIASVIPAEVPGMAEEAAHNTAAFIPEEVASHVGLSERLGHAASWLSGVPGRAADAVNRTIFNAYTGGGGEHVNAAGRAAEGTIHHMPKAMLAYQALGNLAGVAAQVVSHRSGMGPLPQDVLSAAMPFAHHGAHITAPATEHGGNTPTSNGPIELDSKTVVDSPASPAAPPAPHPQTLYDHENNGSGTIWQDFQDLSGGSEGHKNNEMIAAANAAHLQKVNLPDDNYYYETAGAHPTSNDAAILKAMAAASHGKYVYGGTVGGNGAPPPAALPESPAAFHANLQHDQVTLGEGPDTYMEAAGVHDPALAQATTDGAPFVNLAHMPHSGVYDAGSAPGIPVEPGLNHLGFQSPELINHATRSYDDALATYAAQTIGGSDYFGKVTSGGFVDVYKGVPGHATEVWTSPVALPGYNPHTGVFGIGSEHHFHQYLKELEEEFKKSQAGSS